MCDGGDALLLGEEEEQLREDGQEDDEGQLGEEGLQDGAHGSAGKGKKEVAVRGREMMVISLSSRLLGSGCFF